MFNSAKSANNVSWRDGIRRFSNQIVCVFAFLLPGELAPLNVLAVVLIGLWLISFRVETHWQPLRRNPIFWACQAYFWLLVLGMIWTEDIPTGLINIDHALPLAIFVPVLLTTVLPSSVERIITAFLCGAALCVVLAHYNWVQLTMMPHWPVSPWDNPDGLDTAPFVGRIAYTPMLAWAAFLAIRRIADRQGAIRIMLVALTIAILVNMLFSGGRAGIAGFCALLVYMMIRWLEGKQVRAVVFSTALIASLVGAGYLIDTDLRKRLAEGSAELIDYKNNVNGSVSSRVLMGINTVRMIRESPVFGIGTGDWVLHYREMIEREMPEWMVYQQPHNQYLFTQSTIGIAGTLALLVIYFPFFLKSSPARPAIVDMRLALGIWMGSISMFASYLWNSHINMHFLLFLCIAWGVASSVEPRRLTNLNRI